MQDTNFGVLTGNDVATRFVKAGSIVFREGDEATELFVVKSGQVRIQLGKRGHQMAVGPAGSAENDP